MLWKVSSFPPMHHSDPRLWIEMFASNEVEEKIGRFFYGSDSNITRPRIKSEKACPNEYTISRFRVKMRRTFAELL